MSEPRLPVAPRRAPSQRDVAEAALALQEWVADDFAILEFLRTIPGIASEMDRLVAARHYRELREGGIGVVQAQRLVAGRVGVTERTLRSWGLNG
jgi:hypothetical protein